MPPQAGRLLWEQELQAQMGYGAAMPFFHTFSCEVSGGGRGYGAVGGATERWAGLGVGGGAKALWAERLWAGLLNYGHDCGRGQRRVGVAAGCGRDLGVVGGAIGYGRG